MFTAIRAGAREPSCRSSSMMSAQARANTHRSRSGRWPARRAPGMNRSGASRPMRGCPTGQRLDGDERPVGDPHDRLVPHPHLAALDRLGDRSLTTSTPMARSASTSAVACTRPPPACLAVNIAMSASDRSVVGSARSPDTDTPTLAVSRPSGVRASLGAPIARRKRWPNSRAASVAEPRREVRVSGRRTHPRRDGLRRPPVRR